MKYHELESRLGAFSCLVSVACFTTSQPGTYRFQRSRYEREKENRDSACTSNDETLFEFSLPHALNDYSSKPTPPPSLAARIQARGADQKREQPHPTHT